jgi:hypothetical protein
VPGRHNSGETSAPERRTWCHDARFAFRLRQAIGLASVP